MHNTNASAHCVCCCSPLCNLLAVSYNALLEICYKSNDDDRALDVMDRMSDDEVEPDEILLNTVSKKRTWRTYLRKLYG